MEAADLATSIGYTVVGRLAGGEGEGAYEVLTADGTRAVLKYSGGRHLDFARAARTTDALRSRGYPAPATLATGSVEGVRYGVVELLPGWAPSELDRPLLEPAIALVDRQRAVGLPGRAPWLDDMVTSVVDGRSGYCEHGALRVYSPETRALLDRLRAIAHAHADVDVAIDDVVHMDFHTANMLAIDRRITGVIDWEGSTSGDAAFDLVTQALYTPDLRTELLDAARARTDPHALPLYAAHMVLRQVDWSLRHHNAAQVRRYLDEGVALLAATASG